jgi:serine protease Do
MSIAPAAGGGVLVKEIYPGSPADRAGLVPGDVIRRLDHTEVAEMFDLSYELSAKLPGDNGVITIERATRLLELNIDFENYTRP